MVKQAMSSCLLHSPEMAQGTFWVKKKKLPDYLTFGNGSLLYSLFIKPYCTNRTKGMVGGGEDTESVDPSRCLVIHPDLGTMTTSEQPLSSRWAVPFVTKKWRAKVPSPDPLPFARSFLLLLPPWSCLHRVKKLGKRNCKGKGEDR